MRKAALILFSTCTLLQGCNLSIETGEKGKAVNYEIIHSGNNLSQDITANGCGITGYIDSDGNEVITYHDCDITQVEPVERPTPDGSQFYKVLNDQYQYEQVLQEGYLQEQPMTIDFATHQVLLANMGYIGSHSSYEITKVLEFNDFTEVYITKSLPSADSQCVYPATISLPYYFISIESTKELRVEKSEQRREGC